ncbi:hypothetical protein TNIN_280691 [Trichonephila inaurata madagascariensis]|uniref:Uncharacterized protein n=1 Tax=Trichonephila inaurata madagascariensis TaxID=2747483 RepID=A0A8X7CIH4_9ARAC|nr:hypothetical protein TNIN_280691 [Trichonephila inaurata madagascariensis]
MFLPAAPNEKAITSSIIQKRKKNLNPSYSTTPLLTCLASTFQEAYARASALHSFFPFFCPSVADKYYDCYIHILFIICFLYDTRRGPKVAGDIPFLSSSKFDWRMLDSEESYQRRECCLSLEAEIPFSKYVFLEKMA